MRFIVRAAEESDFAGVGEVDAASRLYAYTGVLEHAALAGVTPEAQTRIWSERVARERDTHVMLVAQSEGRVVGYSYVGPGEDPQIGDLYALFVHPDALGTGVAQRLLNESLAVLRGFGYQTMLLGFWKATVARSVSMRSRVGGTTAPAGCPAADPCPCATSTPEAGEQAAARPR